VLVVKERGMIGVKVCSLKASPNPSEERDVPTGDRKGTPFSI
jgi:hypothetical protein